MRRRATAIATAEAARESPTRPGDRHLAPDPDQLPDIPAEPTVLAAWTATVLRALRAHGVDGEALARQAGIDPDVFAVDGARIPLSHTTALWRLAVDATGDPCFGLEVARFVRPATFHALSLGIVSSKCFRDALDRVVRFAPVALTTTVVATGYSRDGRYEWTLRWAPGSDEPSYESVEAIAACIVRAGRFLVGQTLSPVEVHLQRPCPPPTERMETFFGCPVRYGCDHYRMVFDAGIVNQPLSTGNGELARNADRVVAAYLDHIRSAGPVTEQVHQVVAALLAGGEPTSTAVARRLAMSNRTLQRRLHEEGTTFRDIVAHVRIGLAKRFIVIEGLATQQIAARLGFSDPAAFRRAFKRRTGMTPGEFALRNLA